MTLIPPLLRVWCNEVRDVLRDPGILIFIIFVPLAYPLLYSWVYTGEVAREVPAAVVDDCDSPESRRLLRLVDATPDVAIARRCTSMDEARQMVMDHRAYGIIHVPESMSRDLARGEQTTVGLYCDMSSMLYYKALLTACTNVSLELNRRIKVSHYLPGTTERQDQVTAMPIDYSYVTLYNPQNGFAAFLIPPVLMLIIQQTLLLGIGMHGGQVRERCRVGVPLPPLYGNPLRVVVARAMVYLPVYAVMAIYMTGAVTRWFGLPQLAHGHALSAMLLPYLLACVFFAMTLASLIYRREDCIMLFVFLSVPLLFLSGVSWPRESMPAVWRTLAQLFPSTPGMNAYVRVTGMGASAADIAGELRTLWLQAGIYFALACAAMHFEIKSLSTISSSNNR